jgi:dTDP-4-dehydrorhamnose reductase
MAPPEWDVVGVDRGTMDLTDTAALRDLVFSQGPEVIINCAAFTDVDAAQTQQQACWDVNVAVPEALARASTATGARLIHISTDYVFDGTATSPYAETAPVSGLGVYGRTKAAGEAAALAVDATATIVRTAWLYAPRRKNFVATVLRLAAGGGALRIVDDQFGQPTFARDVAGRIIEIIDRNTQPGVYHATNSGQATWFDFASEILRLWGYDNALQPICSGELQRPAPRPAFSVLGHEAWRATGLPPLRDWRSALASARRDFGDEFAGDGA